MQTKTVSSRSDGDNTAAIVGGVLGTVTVLAIMAVIVMVFLHLKNHGALCFTGMKKKYVLYNNNYVVHMHERSRAIQSWHVHICLQMSSKSSRHSSQY